MYGVLYQMSYDSGRTKIIALIPRRRPTPSASHHLLDDNEKAILNDCSIRSLWVVQSNRACLEQISR